MCGQGVAGAPCDHGHRDARSPVLFPWATSEPCFLEGDAGPAAGSAPLSTCSLPPLHPAKGWAQGAGAPGRECWSQHDCGHVQATQRLGCPASLGWREAPPILRAPAPCLDTLSLTPGACPLLGPSAQNEALVSQTRYTRVFGEKSCLPRPTAGADNSAYVPVPNGISETEFWVRGEKSSLFSPDREGHNEDM